ncbi:MAG: 30S ribosomal protein S12 methylthiotransferase RimO [Candidatus Marinimicrobia bacterium]|jgi:ribosomal protein S12 methylthiotransferase|nr:30S ribosomal protein S12 methylthiotransferase RimO [Candidatus Neomarinimicrobiota bacterium]MDP6852536.1 30S ribosomal protein S12 methylthiotransferase RimO [Candidatus Neomarinimicrobiota bacterium]MDP6936154.1 30S ribosomal protein S12 methylthiotransferase RimO [Candidatus Neomarinimicrobiota bacterium]
MTESVKSKVSMISLGCAKNLVDSEMLVGGLKQENYEMVKSSEEADILIVNTCGFLDSAREESVDVILDAGELKKSGEVEKLIVMGCFSDRYGTELRKEIPEVDAFFGTQDHDEILSYLTGKEYRKADPGYFRSLLTPNHFAYLKIAEGCDNGCSFCSIPLMRGLQKSQPLEWNVQEAQRLADNGVKELLVIAQDSTSYGWDLNPRSSLHELMDALNEVNGLEWIRLHYAHPAHLHREMIHRFGELEKLVPYIDMPVQHGSDGVLKSMRRGLNSTGIRNRLESLREKCPEISIRTSIIVGFPGESNDDFKELYNFVEEIEFDRLGVFTYSEEEGTHGATLKDDIPKEVKTERMDTIMLLQQEINYQKNQKLVGKREKVIIDLNGEDRRSVARSYRDAPEVDNFVRIEEELPVGEFFEVEITDASEYELSARRIDNE